MSNSYIVQQSILLFQPDYHISRERLSIRWSDTVTSEYTDGRQTSHSVYIQRLYKVMLR